ncbi:bacteriophage T4 gp5 trimerisation domain-containing protein, partial [Helicobacter sp. T3_23-1056]
TIHTDSFGRVRVRINAFANQAIIDNQILQSNQTSTESSAKSNINAKSSINANDLDSQSTNNPNHLSKTNAKSTNDLGKSNAESSNDSSKSSIANTNKASESKIDSNDLSQSTNNINTNNTKTIQSSTQANAQNNSQDNSQDSMQYYSPYLRVASPIASNASGFYHTPRVGDEVLISFLDNDIDKPYISGSLYNNTNTPNLHLPKDSHKTTFSSKTLGLNEKGINEITLENIKDNELISIHAQKDYDELIEHNFSQTILNNKESSIKGHYNESIAKSHTQDIALAKIIKVGAEY